MKIYNLINYSGYAIWIYYSLNEFINNYKQYYVSKREQQINGDNNFNDVFNDFISWFLYELNIGKYEHCAIHCYDDMIIIYHKNNCYKYHFWIE